MNRFVLKVTRIGYMASDLDAGVDDEKDAEEILRLTEVTLSYIDYLLQGP